MRNLILWGILFLIVYALKKDKKHEKAPCHKANYLDGEWEDFIPEGGITERPWSIEILSSKNHPITQKLEAFSLN